MSYRLLRCMMIILLVFWSMGCDKFLDVVTPASEIEASRVYDDAMTAMMLLYNIYSVMVNQDASPAKLARYTGLCSDELMLFYDQNGEEMYGNNLSSTNVYTTSIWSACYFYIHKANDVYQGCGASEKLDPVIKKQLMAEALFIRAYWFFYLLNLYGDIPLPITTDATINALLYRSSKDTVYQRIISDLLIAQKDLGDNYIGPDSKSNTSERTRPNKATVTALLARVYLYTGRYEDAEQQANAIIVMNDTYDLVPLGQVFLKNSKEAIWQLSPSTPNVNNINTTEGNEFIITQPPRYRMQQAISPSLMKAFDVGDQRRKNWISSYTDRSISPSVTYYYPNKYKISFGTTDIKEYSMIFRLAEIYLIRAECSVRLGRLSEGLADLNKIRQRAGLTPIPEGTLDKGMLLKAILKERQVELFTEQGHRWFDLKRTGIIDSVMATEAPAKGGEAWNSTKQLWPIPNGDIGKAPNLVQNPGY